MNTFDAGSWLAVAPELALGGTALLVLLFNAFRAPAAVQAAVAGIGIFVTALVTGHALDAGTGMTFPAAAPGVSYIAFDGYAGFFFFIFLFVALATCMVAGRYLEMNRARYGEFYATVLLAATGMMVMTSAQDMLILYLGLETMSMAAYVLTGFLSHQSASREAALKYFFMGAFGSALLLYGVAFLYGATGSISFRGIAAGLAESDQATFATMGMAMLVAGLAFKVAAVPFHMWTPDVYHGAPTPVSGLMAVGVKAAAFAALMRIVHVVLADVDGPWIMWVIYGLSALTMIWGNVAAIAQRNIKRMLAYSSIAHAGYLLMAVAVAAAPEGVAASKAMTSPAIMVYLAAYALMTLGAFAVVMLIEKKEAGDLSIASYEGIGRRHPWLGIAMTIFLLSLAGIPPTVGFVGKWYVFSAAIATGQASFINLAIIAVATSLMSVYYYMRVVYVMFMKDETDATATVESDNLAARAVAFGFAAMVVFLGCFPGGVVSLARSAGLL